MASINWTLLCDYAFVSDGKLSMIGICEHIFTKAVPAMHAQLFVAVNETINSDDGAVQFSVEISAPSGKSIKRLDENPIAIQSGAARHNSVFGFYLLKFEEAGDHHVEIFANGQSVHLITLPIIKVQ